MCIAGVFVCDSMAVGVCRYFFLDSLSALDIGTLGMQESESNSKHWWYLEAVTATLAPLGPHLC